MLLTVSGDITKIDTVAYGDHLSGRGGKRLKYVCKVWKSKTQLAG